MLVQSSKILYVLSVANNLEDNAEKNVSRTEINLHKLNTETYTKTFLHVHGDAGHKCTLKQKGPKICNFSIVQLQLN